MTKDEMVQRLYIEYCTHKWAVREECFDAARKHVDYFFENYKPKKKREVVLMSDDLLNALDAAVKQAIAPGFYFEWSLIRNAISTGKSVRLKK